MNKKRTTLVILFIAIIIFMAIGTYAFFSVEIEGNIDQDNIVQSTGTLRIEYSDGQGFDIDELRPGRTATKTFTIKNTGTLPVNYDIVFIDLINTFINDELFYRLTCYSNQNNCEGVPENLVGDEDFYIKKNITIEAEEEHLYELEIEFIETGSNQDYNKQAKLTGQVKIYESGTYIIYPRMQVDIVENMIPITWSSNKWVKTDTRNYDKEWYDYDNQKWANAVLVTDGSRNKYKNADPGMTVLEADILAYFVYVPRYRYLLWNTNHNENCLNNNCGVQEIKIEFENKVVPKSLGTQNGQWLTHPAFTFGDRELNGIWVGKFITSPNPESNCYGSPSSRCNNKSHDPRIKPNEIMWTYVDAATIFSVSKKIDSVSYYGLTQYNNIDSHVMKNMEWGAVAYLSHSKYGKYGNNNFSGSNKEIYINNYVSSSMTNYRTRTGCSSGLPSVASSTGCSYTYPAQSLAAMGASSTGNIYGIYDMSGGVHELVMGQQVKLETTPIGQFNRSNYSGLWGDYNPERKYYDSYSWGDNSSNLLHGRGLLGDATKETLLQFATSLTGGWYGDYSGFVYNTNGNVWFMRGGNARGNTSSGAFSFTYNDGRSNQYRGFRIALIIE